MFNPIMLGPLHNCIELNDLCFAGVGAQVAVQLQRGENAVRLNPFCAYANTSLIELHSGI